MIMRRLLWLTGSLACLAPHTGCSGLRVSEEELLQQWQAQKQEAALLYLRPEPYRKLYIEVDAVEGTEPDDLSLHVLQGVAAARCNKPDGVEFVRDDVIPREAARATHHANLAAQYMDGPPSVESNTCPQCL